MRQSPKQRWSFERNFCYYGSLAGIRSRLIQIAKGHSVLPDEQHLLLEAHEKVHQVIMYWRNKARKEESWEKFKKINKNNKP